MHPTWFHDIIKQKDAPSMGSFKEAQVCTARIVQGSVGKMWYSVIATVIRSIGRLHAVTWAPPFIESQTHRWDWVIHSGADESIMLQSTDDSQGDQSAYTQWKLFSFARAVFSLYIAKDGLINLPYAVIATIKTIYNNGWIYNFMNMQFCTTLNWMFKSLPPCDFKIMWRRSWVLL